MIKKIRLEKIRIVMVSEDILWKQKKNSLLNVNIVSEDIYSKKRRLQKKWFLDGEWGHSVEEKKIALLNEKKITYGEWGHILRLQKNGSWMVSEDILWKKKSRFTEWKKNHIWWVRTFFNVEKELLYWMYHIWWVRTYDAKKNKLWMWMKKNSDTKMVSEDTIW